MLTDKITLVTGAGTGLGMAVVRRFLKEGARVYGAGARTEKAEPAEGFTFLECDVSDEEAVRRVCDTVGRQEGRIDAVVTVCETLFRGGVTEISVPLLEAANRAICLPPMLFTKYAVPYLKKSENPSITHDIPMTAYMTEQNYLNSSYNVSLVNYTRQCPTQIRPIRVNAILFGILTDHLLTEEELDFYRKPEQLAKIPAGRLGQSADVAGVNAFLASDKARYLNSGAWAVDGGYYTMNPRSMGNNGV